MSSHASSQQRYHRLYVNVVRRVLRRPIRERPVRSHSSLHLSHTASRRQGNLCCNHGSCQRPTRSYRFVPALPTRRNISRTVWPDGNGSLGGPALEGGEKGGERSGGGGGGPGGPPPGRGEGGPASNALRTRLDSEEDESESCQE